MRHILCGLLLMFGMLTFAQQQAPSTPPQGVPRQQMPPDTETPPAQQLSSAQVGQQIQDEFKSDPALANENVKANVNDTAVVLMGIVDNENQHQLVLRIAQSYAGDREVLDRIEVKGKA
jgi:osmotically-inducible protein OsmY